MAKKVGMEPKDEGGMPPALPAREQRDPAIPNAPEGLDEAIFKQGYLEARKDQADGKPRRSNPFGNPAEAREHLLKQADAGSHQAESWEAGAAAGEQYPAGPESEPKGPGQEAPDEGSPGKQARVEFIPD